MTQPDPPGDSIKFNWDFLDVVASKGACLIPRPNTPVHTPRKPDVEIEKFATALTSRLEGLLEGQEIRRRKYGDAAFECLPRHTPPELVEKREEELEMLYTLMDAPSPSSDCGNGDEIDRKADLERRREIERILYKPRSDARLEQPPAACLLTPSPSNFESIPNSAPSCYQPLLPMSVTVALEAKRGKKRRPDNTEEGQRKKSRRIAAEANRQSPLLGSRNITTEAATTRGKKRRRSDAEEPSQPKNKKSRTIAAGPERPRRSARLCRDTGLLFRRLEFTTPAWRPSCHG